MKPSSRYILALCFACLLMQSACKKEDDTPDPENPPAFTQGLVSKVTNTDGSQSTVQEFVYGNDELVDSMMITDGGFTYAKIFHHLPGLIVADVPAFGAGLWVDSTWLDDEGRPTRTVKRAFTTAIDFRYLYNTAGELTNFINLYPGGTMGDTTWNVWSGGNLVKSYTHFGDTIHYHYDLSKPYQRGEFRHILTLQDLGRNSIPSANLQTGITQYGVRQDYAFQYDDQGRIVRTSGEGSGASGQLVEYK